MGVNLDRVFSIAAAIVTVALVWTIVQPGSNAAGVIRAVGDSFSHSIAAAQGRA